MHIFCIRSGLRIVLALLCTVPLARPLVVQTNCVFDATSGNAVIPHAPSLNLAPRLTVEAWLKAAPPMPSDYGPVIDKDYLTGPGFGVASVAHRRDSVAAAFVYANNFVLGPLIASDSLTWTHVAVTVDTTTHTAVFYVNGVQASTVTGSFVTFADNSSAVFLGKAKYGDRFSGCIDEVRIWNVIRTPSDISSLWNHEARGNEPGLVAVYHFEDQRDTIAWNRAAGGGLNGPLTPGARIINIPWTIAFTDEHENNDSYANAVPLNYGSSILSAAVAPGDTDIYKIYTRPGDIIRLRTTAKNAGDQVNLRVSVYGPDSIRHITTYSGVFPSL